MLELLWCLLKSGNVIWYLKRSSRGSLTVTRCQDEILRYYWTFFNKQKCDCVISHLTLSISEMLLTFKSTQTLIFGSENAQVSEFSDKCVLPPHEWYPRYNNDTWYGAAPLGRGKPPTILPPLLDGTTSPWLNVWLRKNRIIPVKNFIIVELEMNLNREWLEMC